MTKFIAVFLLSIPSTFAQYYPISDIPEDLKANAVAVVRSHKTIFTVKNEGEASTKVEGVITIFEEGGQAHSNLVIPYNKFTKIKDIEAKLYDSYGTQVKKLKRADIENYGGSSTANSVDDSYVKYAALNYNSYPYTIEYSYEFTTKNMMFYPSWGAIADNREKTAVEQASFEAIMPETIALRYKEQNMPTTAYIVKTGGRTSYRWEVKNLKAIEKEPYSPSLSETMPMVFTAPTAFKVEDYSGNINTWSDLASFYGNLNKDLTNIPIGLTSKIKELVKNEKTDEAKIKKAYEYLQANTRYVSIQLGIGGWQSMKAEEVANKGFGDCKALTTLMLGLLKELDIKAYPALVKAGEDASDIRSDFPSFQFNHVFVCVPQPKKDTLWLECTSQNNPFGYLGDFTNNRHVLLIQDNGGTLVKTPNYRPIDNKMFRKASIKIEESGEAEAEVSTLLTGLQQDSHAAMLNNAGPEEQKKWLNTNLNLASVEIKAFALNEKKDKVPSVIEKLSLHLRNASSKSGSRMFLTLNQLNPLKSVPLPKPDRKVDFELAANYMDIDSITYQVPAGFSSEYLPETVKVQGKFGTYSSSVQMAGDKILYVRNLTLLQGRHPAGAFNEFVDFRKKVVKADKNQVVLVKK